MKMVAHDGKADDVDAKMGRQKLKPPFEPRLAMVVVAAGVGVVATQIAPPHAAIDAVVGGHFAWVDDLTACESSHGDTRQEFRNNCREYTGVQYRVKRFSRRILKKVDVPRNRCAAVCDL
jgi:hypothetical protein